MQTTLARTQRNSSIELLRILSMLMITFCHFFTHSGFDYLNGQLNGQTLWFFFGEQGGNLGVDIFVLISGYFLIMSRKDFFDVRRALKLWGQVFFYAMVFLGLALLGFLTAPGLKDVIKSVFPVSYGTWWFVSTYFVLYLLHPFLNKLLQNLNQSAYRKLLLLLLVCWCLIPTFMLTKYEGNDLLWFVTLYCVAGYVRLYGLNAKFTRKHYGILFVLFMVMQWLSAVAITIVGQRITMLSGKALLFYGKNSVLTFLGALCLFMFFEKTDSGTRKWINVPASAAFGVYLITENPFFRSVLWGRLIHGLAYEHSWVVVPYSIVAVVAIYLICTAVDLLRQVSVEKFWVRLVDSVVSLFENKLKEIIKQKSPK